MNNFTKDELLRLGATVFSTYESSLLDPTFSNEVREEYKSLKDKIESMIDNYCEHEFYVNGYGENVFGQCFKCGEVNRLMRK